MNKNTEIRPIGLLLDLKKRRAFSEGNSAEKFDYLLYGNFDGVNVRKATQWYDLAPTLQMDEEAADIGKTGKFDFSHAHYISTFVLKLLFPKTQDGDVLAGYNYEFWKEAESKSAEEKLYEQASCPFFSMIIIDVSEPLATCFAEQGSEALFTYMAEVVKKCAEKAKIQLPRLNCGLFETFGSHDYILLFRSVSLGDVVRLCEQLKTYEDGELGSHCHAIATGYTVFGIDNWNKKGAGQNMAAKYEAILKESGKDFESVQIAVQYLGFGAMTSELAEALEKAGLEIHSSHGSMDVIASIEGKQFAKIVPQYFGNGYLNPANTKYNIRTTRTMFVFKEMGAGSTNAEPLKSALTWEEKYNDIFENFKEMRKVSQRSQRLTTALRQTVLQYINIAQDERAFDIRHLLGPMFDSLFENMGRTMLELGKYNGQNDPNGWEQEKLWNEFEIALQSFRELVGNFLSDIALSDKYLLEDSQLRHPPIGSATKLIFMYNRLVNEFSKKLHVGLCKYRFLVKSGGSDNVCVTNIFQYLPTHKRFKHCEDCLLVIELPERLLYHVQFSLFAILHEIFHIVGERKREKRFETMKCALSDFIAFFLESATDKKDLYNLARPTQHCKEEIKANTKKSLENLAKDWGNSYREKVSEKILERINIECEKKEELIPEETENYLFARWVVDLLKGAAQQLFTPSFWDCNSLLWEIYQIHHAVWQELSKDLEKSLAAVRTQMELFFRTQERYQKVFETDGRDLPREHRNYLDGNVFCKLFDLFNLLNGNTTDLDLEGNESTDEAFFTDERNRIEAVITICYDTMNEAFSDCMAIKILKMPLQDYLCCHYSMNEGTLNSRLPLDAPTVLRFGCVLEAAYGIAESEDLNSKQREIEKKMEILYKTGALAKPPAESSLKAKPEPLFAHIKEAIEECNKSYKQNKVKEHIVEYLKEAIDTAHTEAKKQAKEAIQEFRALYEEADPAESHGIADLPHHVLDQWLKLAKKEAHDDNRTGY